MAKFVAKSQLDMFAFLTNASLAGLFDAADVITHTATQFTIKDVEDTQEVLTINGSLGYEPGNPYPVTGTITGGSYRPGNTDFPSFDFSGASISVESFSGYVNDDDAAGMFNEIFAGNDQMTGSSFDDVLFGFGGNDVIDGRAGADIMFGGAGNDRYIVDSASDEMYEEPGAGTDRVDASITYALAPDIEQLVLTGTANINGTGNELVNKLTGNSGANTLNGLAGADTMTGGAGNDTYVVDNSNDHVVELAGGGTDIVKASVNFTLAANVERLTLTGTANVKGTGNTADNVMVGNGGANVLSGLGGVDSLNGGAGNDQLIGGAGNDKLTGGTGIDKFVFSSTLASAGVDRITDFHVAEDRVVLDQTVFTALTTTGTLTNANFFAGTAAHDADDRVIYDSTTGRIYYDADGTGAGHQVLIAQVNAGLAVTHSDFLIVA